MLKTADSLRTGEPQARFDYARATPEELSRRYGRAYEETAQGARLLAQRYDFSRFRHLVDVGGGSGGASLALTQICPALRATVADFPGVIKATRKFLEDAGAATRVGVLEVNVTQQAIPGVYDVALLRNFLPALDGPQARQAIKNVAAALEPGGMIFINDLGTLDDSRVSPLPVVAFNLFFINNFSSGQAHTEAERREWLKEAGFVEVKRDLLPDQNSVMTARKPKS